MTNIYVTIGASIISGLLGVIITLIVQRYSVVKQQKIAILQTLLANRHQLTAEENVKALNAIDVVFYNDDEVRSCLSAFIDATNIRPADGISIVKKYLRLVESVSNAVGMKKLDWERIDRCFYNPISLAERTQENDLLRKAMLQNQMNLVNQRAVKSDE